jgi:NAD(P)-dependent dehydrogenase (short-subunit alcohol dehydrogenase family)
LSDGDTLLLGHDGALARTLAGELGASLCVLPRGASDADLETWRARLAAGPTCGRVVVALGHDPAPNPLPLCEIETALWQQRAEVPFLAWCVALGAAASCCADGGAIVAVAEAPPPLDAAGFAPESGLAEAVGALVRSIARAEGGRGVRANAVTTPARLRLGPVPDPAPALASFPGQLAREVAGAVRLLLSDEARGITGRTVPADCGRSW